MSRIQKVLLILSCVLFAVTLYALFYLGFALVVLCFLLHSLFLILFSYQCYVTNRKEENETMPQEIGMKMAELTEKERSLAEMQSTLIEKETALETVQRENETLKYQVKDLTEREKSLKEELDSRLPILKEEVSHSEEAPLSGLLPPLPEDAEENGTVDLIALANMARNELMESAKAANLHISVSSGLEKLDVKADANRLLVLFRNIIDNSIKYMKRAGSLVITISTIGDDIFIVLKDTGEGLNEDETKHIFELNFQGSNRISGNGLGLAQARAIVDYYGGTIYAKSTEGKGMGIYIQLPA